MTEMPCFDCAKLIGATSTVIPHFALNMLIFKKQLAVSTHGNLVEFYRCENCRALLVRDLHQEDRYAQWDWVKSATNEGSRLH